MAGSKPVKTPFPPGFKSVPASDEEYPAKVGFILYADTFTLPDTELVRAAHRPFVVNHPLDRLMSCAVFAASFASSELFLIAL
jgi:hypothetical protein